MTRVVTLIVLIATACLSVGATASGTGKTLRVAYVDAIASAPGHRDLRAVALLGLERAVKSLPVEARVVQFAPRQAAGPLLTLLASERYDLILVGEVRSPDDVDAVSTVARRFPGTKFVLTDPPVRKKWPANVEGSFWRVEQPAYLAGYLAALIEQRRPGKDVVGSVGGFPIVSVDTFMAGFEAGAKAADPRITVLRGYAYDFLNPARCRSVALSQIVQGAGVLFNVAGACGLGTLQAAKTKGVWGIGVDVDQSFLGPHVLTSVLKRFDVQVYDIVHAFVLGKLKTGGNAVWTLRNGAVGLGRISPKVPAAILDRLARVRRGIAAGTIRVPTRLSRG